LRTILHLSDLHFGRIDPTTLDPLLEAAREIRPEVVAISGDLTQRARRGQFRQAREFLEKLPGMRIVVPGNHDVPLYNVVARFAFPLVNYRRYISEDLEPFYSDSEIAIVGINTAYSRTFKGGRVTRQQIARLQERLCGAGPDVTKMVVTHHPIDLPETYSDKELVRRARMVMEALVACDADVLLAGHLHTPHASGTTERHRIQGHTALIVQAGTATSTRGRGQPNSFNVIRVERPAIDVRRHDWSSERGAFLLAEESKFVHGPSGWQPVLPSMDAGGHAPEGREPRSPRA
jgi:3',5'-cyclic AMP phosphodiesterase CpdA